MMMRRVMAVLLATFLVACEGSEGPTGPTGPAGPAGPAGPQGPAGESVAYLVFEGEITQTVMGTDAVDTGGVAPGIVCYISSDGTTWLTLGTDTAEGSACAVSQETATTYVGAAVVDASFVNSGWTLRIILFWLPG